MKDWTSDQCIQWLTAQEMTSFIPIFLSRNIDGEKLLLLDSAKMKVNHQIIVYNLELFTKSFIGHGYKIK